MGWLGDQPLVQVRSLAVWFYVGVVYGCECKQCSLPFPRPPPLRPPRKESSKDLEGFLFRGPLARVLFAEWVGLYPIGYFFLENRLLFPGGIIPVSRV